MGRESSFVKVENIEVIPYGRWAEKLKFSGSRKMRVIRNWKKKIDYKSESLLWVVSVQYFDEEFRKSFCRSSALNSRILVINDSLRTDTLLSRLMSLNIRTSERFYIAEVDEQKRDDVGLADALLGRISAAVSVQEVDRRILDARIENGVLNVIAPSFKRLELPIASIPEFGEVDEELLKKFEIDSDGAYLYWPDLDVHLGWDQLNQIADPEAARKALRRSKEFNVRYGAAIRKFRRENGLSSQEIPGLSDKQIGRIERGVCRSTSQALEKLAKAHGLDQNEYMQRVAEAMQS